MDLFRHALSTPVASSFSLVGPDTIVLLLILVLLGVPIIGIVILIIVLSRGKPAQRPPPLPTARMDSAIRPRTDRTDRTDRQNEG
jgi:hypothetical protein